MTNTINFVALISVMIWRGRNTTITVHMRDDHSETFEICPGSKIQGECTIALDSFGTVGIAAHAVPPFCGRESINFLKEKLTMCLNRHGMQCARTASPSLLPRFLLSLGSSDSEIRVLDTKEFVKVDESAQQYVALSYCWGAISQLHHTTQNSDKLRTNVPIQELSRLCQDVIQICRDIGLQYLWIDALCIVQDDSQFWASESSRMARIYDNATLVIAAIRAADPSCALIGMEAKNKLGRCVDVKLQDYTGSTSYLTVREVDSPNHPTSCSGPLSTRAWAYQEKLMARRIIQFTDYELIWQCSSVDSCECHLDVPKIFDDRKAFHDWNHNLWYLWISEYSQRSLTYFNDRLPAISGTASLRKMQPTEKYLAGLWMSSIHADMLWCAQATGPQMRRFAPSAEARGGPSWSWVSITARIWMKQDASIKGEASVEAALCKPLTSNLFGAVAQDSQMQLSGKILAVDVKHASPLVLLPYLFYAGTQTEVAPFLADAVLIQRQELGFTSCSRATSAAEASSECANPNSAPCQAHCMLWASGDKESYFLVLGGAQSREGIYQRLGLLIFDHEWPTWTDFSAEFEHLDLQGVTLV